MALKTFIKRNLAFLIPVLIFVITGIVFLSLYSKDDIHIAANSWFSASADIFFMYVTHLGDGLAFLIMALILIFVKWRYVIGLLIAGIFTLLLTGFFKNVVYKGQPRPVKYFENIHELRLVEGVSVHELNSFPSGHTTTAFACWGFTALLIASGAGKFAMFLIAAFVSYSRIYLSQHFLEDVIAGAFLGTLIALVSYYFMWKIRGQWAEGKLGKKEVEN